MVSFRFRRALFLASHAVFFDDAAVFVAVAAVMEDQSMWLQRRLAEIEERDPFLDVCKNKKKETSYKSNNNVGNFKKNDFFEKKNLHNLTAARISPPRRRAERKVKLEAR